MAVVSEGNQAGGAAATPQGGATGPAANKAKRNKLLLYGGGALGVILLLAHKGSGSGQAGNDPQLQAAEAAAAQQALDNEMAQTAGTVVPQAVAPAAVDATTGTASGVTAPTGSEGVNGADPQTAASNGQLAAAELQDAAADAQEAAADQTATASQAQSGGGRKKPAPKRPKGGRARGHTTKNTGHSGTTVHGRHFPGATGHRITNTQRVGQDVHQTVHVSYGGRTDVHVSVNTGSRWIDHKKGHNPPSRGVPRHVAPHQSAPRPAPARRAAPARRPASRPVGRRHR